MIASVRVISLSSKLSSCSRMPRAPGSMPSIPLMEPMFLSCCICLRKSSSVKVSVANFSAVLRASSSSKASCACSIRVRMSPRSRMRLAMRSGWNGSKSSSPSPVDANMIGRPVMDATESAAPPRASPSSLVSTTPREVDALLERAGRRDRVLADHRVDDEQHLVGVHGLADVATPASSARRRCRGGPRYPR